jgi:hypothetical protein
MSSSHIDNKKGFHLMTWELRNRNVAGLQAICSMPGIWDGLRVAMKRRGDTWIQAGDGHTGTLTVR